MGASAFTESTETSEWIYFAFRLAFDVNFIRTRFNSLDVPVNVPTFTSLPLRSKSIRFLKLHRSDGFKAIACKHITQGRLLVEYSWYRFIFQKEKNQA